MGKLKNLDIEMREELGDNPTSEEIEIWWFMKIESIKTKNEQLPLNKPKSSKVRAVACSLISSHYRRTF